MVYQVAYSQNWYYLERANCFKSFLDKQCRLYLLSDYYPRYCQESHALRTSLSFFTFKTLCFTPFLRVRTSAKLPRLAFGNPWRQFSKSRMSEKLEIPPGINPLKEDGTPKTAKEIEKEQKKAEKAAKFAAKQAKQAGQPKQASAKAAKPAAKPKEAVPEFVDNTKPGDKKILVSLDDPALKAYVPKNVESSWYDWWVEKGFFKPYLPNGEISPKGKFVIPAPPPNVTGALHIGHALTISLQDTLVRYNRMMGRTTLFIPGFDHAGISTQSVVEKNVWKSERKTRHDYGREKFVDLVWDWKKEYHARIKNQIQALGASYDWSREAFTMDDDRYAAVVHAFVTLFEDGSLYRSKRMVNWSVALQTTLSNLEVVNKEVPGRTMMKVPGYDEPVEFGVITSFAYPVVGSDEKLVVATTRPETVFGDTAVAVHPEDPRYRHLHGARLKHPLLDREVPLVLDSVAVDMEFGTGAVKITPAHDTNDYETGKRHNLEFITVINDDGLLNEHAGKYAGMKRFDARKAVIADLKKNGLYVEQKDNPMSVPTCDKSGDVVEPVLKPQWWLNLNEPAQEAIAKVKAGELKISPKSSETEYYHWLENLQDWCVSRQLWWGHRCPVYLVELQPGKKLDAAETSSWIAGHTEEEALEKARARFPEHASTLKLYQDEDVLDTWFSSGLWPMTTLGWPKQTFDMDHFFPMTLLETGWDILFFWVTRMIMLSLKLKKSLPFTEVFCHSLVRDAQGRKMSKSLGNVVDPLDVISGIPLSGLHDKLKLGNLDPNEVKRASEGQAMSFPNGIPECGTDALRFAMCAYTSGGRDINLDIYRVEGYRKFCNKIYQATKFALMRLGPDYQPPAKPHRGTSLVENWILHKLSVAGQRAAEHLDRREFMDATSVVYHYWLYEFCDVYIENSKSLILEGTPEERQSARDTLYTGLDGALRMIHPFMPFLTEELWQRLPKSHDIESITIAPYPQEQLFDEAANDAYETVLEVAKTLRSLFSDYGIAKNGHAVVSAQGPAAAMLKEQKQSILSIVKQATELEITEDAGTPAGCVVGTVSPQINAYVVVRGHVDLDQEIAKAHAKTKKIEQQRANVIKQTQVPGYVDKVRAEIRELNESKIEGFAAELKSLDAVVAQFEQLKL